MNKKEVFDYIWTHKSSWERNSDEERAHLKFLEELKEYYNQPQGLYS